MRKKGNFTAENTENAEVDSVASVRSVANTEDLPDGFQMTELGPLPKEWQVVRFDQVITRAICVPKVKQSDYQPIGLAPIIDQGQSFIAGYTDKVLPYKDKLPVIVFGDHTRVLKFVDFPFVAGADGTQVLIPNSMIFDPLFVYYALSTIKIPNRGYNRHFNLLRGSSLPLPPLPEQRAIAHVLRTVQRAKEAADGVIAALKELKKSLMQHLFTCGPVPVTERERVALQESELGPLPAHWRVMRLGEVAELRTGPFGSLLHASDYVEDGIPFVMPKDLSSTGQILPHSIARIRQNDRNRLNNYLLQVGDVILGRRGEIGRRALVTKKEEGWVCGSGCLRIRPNEALYPLYLSYLFEIEVVRCYLSSEAIGTTMANLNTQILSGLPVPLPPLDEQREIARILQAVDARIAAGQARRAALEELFKTLLHELMSGRLRLSGD